MGYFYSRPCGRGDVVVAAVAAVRIRISTHAPAGGATKNGDVSLHCRYLFLLTPLREGRPISLQSCGASYPTFLLTPLREGRPVRAGRGRQLEYFYSRPCGRGDKKFLHQLEAQCDFYSRPCGRGDSTQRFRPQSRRKFLLTPLREGRLSPIWILQKTN